MGLGNIGWSGVLLVLIALLLVFGPSKLPEIGKAFGKSLKEFRNATQGAVDEVNKERYEGEVNANQAVGAKTTGPAIEWQADSEPSAAAQSEQTVHR